MIRRAALVSTLRRTAWRPDEGGPDPLVTGAVVDGEPMAAPRPDTVDLFPVRKLPPAPPLQAWRAMHAASASSADDPP